MAAEDSGSTMLAATLLESRRGPVIAHHISTKSTIEEKIMTLQHKKNLMVNNVLGEGGFTQLLQKEDFDFLFDIEAEKIG